MTKVIQHTVIAFESPCPQCGESDHEVTAFSARKEDARPGDPVRCSCGHSGTWVLPGQDAFGGDIWGVEWDHIPDLAEAIVVECESCPHCGAGGQITTRARQRKGWLWFAYDGDDVECPSCLATGIVSSDTFDESAWINWEDDQPHPPQDACIRLDEAVKLFAEAAGLGQPDDIDYHYHLGKPAADVMWSKADANAMLLLDDVGVRTERVRAQRWSAHPWVRTTRRQEELITAGHTLARMLAGGAP